MMLAMELRLSCTNPSICSTIAIQCHKQYCRILDCVITGPTVLIVCYETPHTCIEWVLVMEVILPIRVNTSSLTTFLPEWHAAWVCWRFVALSNMYWLSLLDWRNQRDSLGNLILYQYIQSYYIPPCMSGVVLLEFGGIVVILAILYWLGSLASRNLGAISIRKTVLPGMSIPMLKIRRPDGRLILNMEIAIRR